MKQNSSDTGISVNILDKEYLIACPEEERSSLLTAARMLDKNMREIHSSGKVVGSDRIAVMAALNIAHDLISLQSGSSDVMEQTEQKVKSNKPNTESRIHAMQEKINQVLNNQGNLDL